MFTGEKRDIFASVVGHPLAQASNSVAQQGGLPLGIFSIVTGIFLAFFGRKLYRFSSFLVGFYVFSIVSFITLLNIEPRDEEGKSLWPNRDYVYIGICSAIGLLGGIVSSVLRHFGIFIVGSCTGFFLSAYIITSTNYEMSEIVVVCWIVGCSLVFGIASLFFIDISEILGTSIIGGYLTGFGIDAFVNSGIMQSLGEIITRQKKLPTVSLSLPAIGILTGMIVIAIIGSLIQFWMYKRKKNNELL
jgi:hypothetical protein